MEDFIVDSNGYCFLCLETILPIQSHHQFPPIKLMMSSSSSIHSIQPLSRYLKLDMRKIFNVEGPAIPPDLLTKVKNARLKVELCEGCASLNKKLFKLCRRLEAIEMEVTSCVDQVHGKLVNANETGKVGRCQMLNEGNKNKNFKGKLDIVEVLRAETMRKCTDKLKSLTPRTQIPNLTIMQVEVKRLRIQNSFNGEREPSESMEQSDLFQLESVKAEELDSDPLQMDTEYFADLEGEQEDGIQREGSNSPILIVLPKHESSENNFGEEDHFLQEESRPFSEAPSQSSASTSKNFRIDPKTRKRRCNHCSKEFESYTGFYYHFRRVHLQAKFKCTVCDKEFCHKHHFDRHYQRAHMGVRFKCQYCGEEFSQKHRLTKHVKIEHCKIKKASRH